MGQAVPDEVQGPEGNSLGAAFKKLHPLRLASWGVRRRIPGGYKMAHGDETLSITRREFYGALTIVWAYIWVVIGALLRFEGRWTTGILWLASLMMVVAYSWQIRRTRPANAIADKTVADRPPD
jgi:hypothetical protein